MLLAKQPILADAYTLLNVQCQFLIPGLLYIAWLILQNRQNLPKGQL